MIKIANGFLKRLYISYCPAFSYSVRTIRRKKSQTNRNSKKRFLPSLNKKGKSTAMSALL